MTAKTGETAKTAETAKTPTAATPEQAAALAKAASAMGATKTAKDVAAEKTAQDVAAAKAAEKPKAKTTGLKASVKNRIVEAKAKFEKKPFGGDFLFTRISHNGARKYTDALLSEAIDEVDANHDGFLEADDIPTLLAAMGYHPWPSLCKYYWEKHADFVTKKIDLNGFKDLLTDISPMVAFRINQAKSG